MNKESISSIDMEVREYCRVHDAYFDPIRDEWIEGHMWEHMYL